MDENEKNVYDIVGAFQELEENLIDSMRRNMKKHIGDQEDEEIEWTQWQAEQLKGLREFINENRDIVGDYCSTINDKIDNTLITAYSLGVSDEEIEILKAIKAGYAAKKVHTIAGKPKQAGEFFRQNDRKMRALLKATHSDFDKVEKAIMRRSEDIYRQTIFKTHVAYSSGSTSLTQAIDKACKDFMRAGINCVEYKNGTRVNIASYAEMALRTTSTRAQLQGQAAMRKEYGGINTIIVTAHNTACPLCTPWQGKIYIDDVYGDGTAEEAQTSHYPLLSKAIKGGLFHPNCRNGIGTYYEGINEAPTPATEEQKEKMIENYNLSQTQRYYERNIRYCKREMIGAMDEETKKQAAARLDKWTAKYNDLIDKHPNILKEEPERLKLYGISTSGKNKAINLEKMSVVYSGDGGMIKMNLQFFADKSKQYGKKIGKHAQDFGLGPSAETDRKKMYKIISDIKENSTEKRIGAWKGQAEEVLFHIKNNDVVITKQNGEFVTIIKDGMINSERIKKSRKL